MEKINDILIKAKKASKVLSNISSIDKSKALENIAISLESNIENILYENAKDIKNATVKGISKPMIERLTLTVEKINGIIKDIYNVIKLEDPIGKIIETNIRPNGLIIEKVRVPLGVIAVIYESRPNVTIDISSLCIKTGNVVVLKGGSEALNTNIILTRLMQSAIKSIMPTEVITFIESTDHNVVNEIITNNLNIDVVIPRGGKGLINNVCMNATVPVIETGAGVCHLYIEKEADMNKALAIAKNAKLSRPSVCNAIETLLVDQEIAPVFLKKLAPIYKDVEIRGCSETLKYINGIKANEDDYNTEYNDYIINIKVVKSIEEAIEHIDKFSTKHSEAIVTENVDKANVFLERIDSACIYHNASTRFTDGGCFGFGTELGISTQKIHARGPIGLNEMTSYKYKIHGNGQVRQ